MELISFNEAYNHIRMYPGDVAEVTLHKDYETFTAGPDLKKVGAWNYSLHPSTIAHCMAYGVYIRTASGHQGYCVQLWQPDLAFPYQFYDMVSAGYVVKAFNWWFEYSIHHNVMRRENWFPELPVIPIGQWECTAARTRSYSAPPDLDRASNELQLKTVKDKEGHRIMMQLMKPKKPSKKDANTVYTKELYPEKYEKLYNYCHDDTVVEILLDKKLPPWHGSEYEIFRLDQRITARGIPVDVELCEAALRLIDESNEKYNRELQYITGHKVTEVAKLTNWVNEQGVYTEDLSADTITEILYRDIPDNVRQALKIRQMLAKTSVGKYKTIMQAQTNGYVLDVLLYAGALSTLRWAGRKIQPQNFPRGNLKAPKGVDYDEFIERVVYDFKTNNLETLELLYGRGEILDILSSLLRSAICAPEGYEFIDADFSNIESRVLFWIAKEAAGLAVFERGEDIYIDMASDIYGLPYDEIYTRYKEGDGTAKSMRQMGKQAILGLGYQMSAKTFIATVYKYSIVVDIFTGDFVELQNTSLVTYRENFLPACQEAIMYLQAGEPVALGTTTLERHTDTANRVDDVYIRTNFGNCYVVKFGQILTPRAMLEQIEIAHGKHIVDTYRGKFPAVKKFWYNVEAAVVKCMSSGEPTECNGIKFFLHEGWLFYQFPNGGLLGHRGPRLAPTTTPWGAQKMQFSYMGLDSQTNQWVRTTSYGGKMVENIVQRIARDLLAFAMGNVESMLKIPVHMHVHDEMLGLIPVSNDGEYKTRLLAEYVRVLKILPSWAAGLPMDADGWINKRFKKD